MTNSTETERAKLIAERAELIAKNEAATSWGAAVGERSERIKEIDRRLAAIRSFAQEQKPVAWTEALRPFAACVFNDNGDITIDTSHLRTADYVAANDALKAAYLSPPPALGWDEKSTRDVRWLVSSARAFLRHFNPCDLAEDKSQQWQSLSHQCDVVARALHTTPAATKPEPAVLTYTNYRGETSVRSIIPRSVRYGSTEWHPEPQWLLLAYDTEKQANREFTLKDFGVPDHGGADAGVRVKPLEWIDRVNIAPRFKAVTIIGAYYIEHSKSGQFNWWNSATRCKIEVRTAETAKAAAQADYERRILSALSHQPAPVAANASAEARLREALRDLVALVSTDSGYDDSESLRSARNILFAENKAAMTALSAHPHASDCAKEAAAQYRKTVDDTWRMNDKGEVPDSDCVMDGETTKSEGLGLAQAGTAREAPGSATGCLQHPNTQVDARPSDRTADVKCEACSGTGRHMGRFSMNDPDCTYCSGKGKVLAGDCDKQGEDQ